VVLTEMQLRTNHLGIDSLTGDWGIRTNARELEPEYYLSLFWCYPQIL